MTTIVWFRSDLRLSDHPALVRAVEIGRPILPLYIYSPEEERPWEMGTASRWWLHHSLKSLQKDLKERGLSLCIEKGPVLEVLKKWISKGKITHLLWNQRYEPALLAQEKRVISLCRSLGCTAEALPGDLLFQPGTILTQTGNPYQVFTPFWNACTKEEILPPLPPFPKRWKSPSMPYKGLHLEDLPLLSDKDLIASWEPGEKGAWKRLKSFHPKTYQKERDFPAEEGTSRLSPHLHFGEITPRQVFATCRETPFLRQIGWREFAHHLLYFFPKTPFQPLKSEYAGFPWKKRAAWLKAWQRGETGVPIIDAGMRELLETGWMHNRVRMLVASFLVKDLLIPWQEGAKWFWETLVDADLANNTLGWQWCAGCGADAAPFFRIFNPYIQSKKFDPKGEYIRRYVPELASLSSNEIHRPSHLKPLVDHDIAGKAALLLYKKWAKS
ncbi:MAG: deoxyribodipyrimidine photo-lyase [Verrucomicrobia bacterium]|nr:deoxyribodipyrimidine photo-lyase [Verrucomicrobiota bacterium]